MSLETCPTCHGNRLRTLPDSDWHRGHYTRCHQCAATGVVDMAVGCKVCGLVGLPMVGHADHCGRDGGPVDVAAGAGHRAFAAARHADADLLTDAPASPGEIASYIALTIADLLTLAARVTPESSTADILRWAQAMRPDVSGVAS